jgi:DHA1 family bicyclomycin/chloramphenicol resistance-like MFS transporter
VALFLAAALQIGGICGVVIPLLFVIGSLGFVGANAIAGALEPFPELAGTTASLFGFFQMMLGAAMGGLVGVLRDGTTMPMGAMIGVLSVLGLLSCVLIVRPARPDA